MSPKNPTGRTHPSEPALQIILVRTELGAEIRRAFVADPSHQLVAADYSEIERRLLSYLFMRAEDL
jgi:DNA polymerase-1